MLVCAVDTWKVEDIGRDASLWDLMCFDVFHIFEDCGQGFPCPVRLLYILVNELHHLNPFHETFVILPGQLAVTMGKE